MRATNAAATFEYVDETPRRPRRSPHQAKAEDALKHHFVTVVSYDRPAPRHFGDNQGYWPVHVELNADWRKSGVVFDHQQPAHRAVRLEVLVVRSRKAAERLKDAIDEALMGRATDVGEPLRYRFRNAVEFGPFDLWWGPLLCSAVHACSDGLTELDILTRSDHDRMVNELADRLMDSHAVI